VFSKMHCPSLNVQIELGETLMNEIMLIQISFCKGILPYAKFIKQCNKLAAPYFHRCKTPNIPQYNNTLLLFLLFSYAAHNLVVLTTWSPEISM